jgi:hypothetical protein
MDPITSFLVEHVIGVMAEIIMPVMFLAFLIAIVVRLLIYYVAKAEYRFTREFEKRVHRVVSQPDGQLHSFHKATRAILEKTYIEGFELRNKYQRRNLDQITGITDRIFLIQEGVIRVIQDTLKQTRYLRKENINSPKMLDLSKNVFDNNPVFNRLLGVFPMALLNELLNILPSLFIIGGIFGTFLGISMGLPELGNMDLGQMDATKKTMDLFLVKISQAMVKSIVGIGVSVIMSLLNTVFAPENIYYNLVNKFSTSLDQLWNESKTNEVDPNEAPFIGSRAPLSTGQGPRDSRGKAA